MTKLEVPTIDMNADLKIESVKEVGANDLPQQEKAGKAMFVFGTIAGVLIMVGVMVMATLYYKTPEKKQTILSPTPVAEITEVPKIVLKNEEITFEVLNASGKVGQAKKYKSQLEKMGYKVNSIGNDPGTYTGILIYTAKQLESQKDALMTDLNKEFPKAYYAGELSGSTSMVKMVIGL